MPKQTGDIKQTLNTQSASNGELAKDLGQVPLDKTQLLTRQDLENIVAQAAVPVEDPVEERDEFLSDQKPKEDKTLARTMTNDVTLNMNERFDT